MFVAFTSTTALRDSAMERSASASLGPLTVACDGRTAARGRLATLSEAIVACGRYDLRQAA